MIRITDQQLELFMSLFRGREDVYAHRWEKNERSGYSPAYDFNWNEFMAHKRRGGSMKDFENKKLFPLTKEVVKKQLSKVKEMNELEKTLDLAITVEQDERHQKHHPITLSEVIGMKFYCDTYMQLKAKEYFENLKKDQEDISMGG